MSNSIVNDVRSALIDGKGRLLKAVPALINRILEDELWKSEVDKEGKHFKTFREFCEYRLWFGLETKFDKLKEFCRDHPECHRRLVESDSISAQKAERDEAILEMREQGLTQEEIAMEVGVSRRRVGQVMEEKSANSQKTSITQSDRSEIHGISRRTQVKIDKIRTIDPALADACEQKEIKVDTAMKQVGLKKVKSPVEKIEKLIVSTQPDELLKCAQLILREADQLPHLELAKEAVLNLNAEELSEFLSWIRNIPQDSCVDRIGHTGITS